MDGERKVIEGQNSVKFGKYIPDSLCFPERRDFKIFECTINVKTEMRMFQFKTFATTPVPASLTIGSGHVEDLFYIPDISRDDRDMQMFLKESGATRSGDLMVFRVNEFDFDPLLLFEDLVAIPSVVINYKIFMAGTHIINFRFHSSNLDQVTNFMSRAFSTFKNFVIDNHGWNSYQVLEKQ